MQKEEPQAMDDDHDDDVEDRPSAFNRWVHRALYAELAAFGAAGACAAVFSAAAALHDYTALTPERQLQDWGYDTSRLSQTPNTNTRVLHPSNPLSYPKVAWEKTKRYFAREYIFESPAEFAARVYEERNNTGYAFSPLEKNDRGYISPIHDDNHLRSLMEYSMPDGTKYNLLDEKDIANVKAFVVLHEWKHIDKGVSINGASDKDTRTIERIADLYAAPALNEMTDGQSAIQTIIRWRTLNANRYLIDELDFTGGSSTHDTALHLIYQQSGQPRDPAHDTMSSFIIRQQFKNEYVNKGKRPQSIDEVVDTVETMREDNAWYASIKFLSAEEKQDITVTLDAIIEALVYLKDKGPEPTSPEPKPRGIIPHNNSVAGP